MQIKTIPKTIGNMLHRSSNCYNGEKLMKTSKFLLFVARIAQFGLLTILFALIYIQTSRICAPYLPDLSNAQPGPIPSPFDFLVVSAGHVAVIMILILSSRWVSWKLSLAVFFAYFGVTTVMAQIETAYFLTGLTLPPGLLPRLVEMGFLTAVIFIPLAVVILWRMRKYQIDSSPSERPARGATRALTPAAVGGTPVAATTSMGASTCGAGAGGTVPSSAAVAGAPGRASAAPRARATHATVM